MSEPQIIYENKDFLAVNKPAGLIVHGVRIGYRPSPIGNREGDGRCPIPDARLAMPEFTLVDWLLLRYPEIATVGDEPTLRPGIVHRLDKDTSGVMLVARNQKTFEYLKSLFQKHEIKKTYLAVVLGELKQKEGTIDAPIGILTGSTKRSVHSKKMMKEAVTEYKVIGYRKSPIGNWESGIANRVSAIADKEKQTAIPYTRYPIPEIFSLLEIHPKTGRTHQIRVHLASIGHPIIGDKLYGVGTRRKGVGTNRLALSATRLALHALSIEFVAPDGNRMRFEAEPPPEFMRFVVK